MVGWRHDRPPDGLSLGSRVLRVGAGLIVGWLVGWLSVRLLVVTLYPGWTGQATLAADQGGKAAIALLSVGAQIGASILAVRYALRWRRP